MISLALWGLIFFAIKCFAEETVIKVDDYSAKITISSVNDKDGVKTTISQEKVFTLDELNTAKTASEAALKSWQDEVKKCEDNITLQTNQITLWQKLIDKCKTTGIVSKPTVKPEVEVTPII